MGALRLGPAPVGRLCFIPERRRSSNGIDPELIPPHELIASSMKLAVVDSAKGHRELVAYLASERPWLREPKVVRVRRLSATYKAGLGRDKLKVGCVPEPRGGRER